MPVHDWTRVSAGTFHDFHCSWITHLKETLNGDLLSPPYYAQSEQQAGEIVPDVLTLSAETQASESSTPDGALAVAEAPPKVAYHKTLSEADTYRARRRSIAIRHRSGHRLVAIVEVLSPGNKDGDQHVRAIVDKSVACIQQGIHLLVIDLFPPGTFDPEGIHGAIWSGLGYEGDHSDHPDQPLTLASYLADRPPEAYVQPVAVGEELIDMPVFLDVDHYVNVPLQPTYDRAWKGVPKIWRDVVEGS